MGIVGNEGSRKDIVILGDPLERAFLYMQAATKQYAKIFVDYESKMEASLFIDFIYVEHIDFSHKLNNYAIYQPIDPMINLFEKRFDIKSKVSTLTSLIICYRE